MLNNKNPGTILAIMSVVMGIMYWMIFCLCHQISIKLNPGGYFSNNFWIYVLLGLVLPLVGISGGYINVHLGNENDERPIRILAFGVFIIIISILVDAKMIIDAFSSPSLHDMNAD